MFYISYIYYVIITLLVRLSSSCGNKNYIHIWHGFFFFIVMLLEKNVMRIDDGTNYDWNGTDFYYGDKSTWIFLKFKVQSPNYITLLFFLFKFSSMFKFQFSQSNVRIFSKKFKSSYFLNFQSQIKFKIQFS